MKNKEVAVAWFDLTYRSKRYWFEREKVILKDLKGCVNFGSINALMGPSGSGKTTLLNCLNGRNKSELDPKTKIYLNSNEEIRSSFIGQNVREHLIMSLTAKQTLIYASKLKNSLLNEKISHNSNAMNLLSELLITNCENTRVSDMSGGEQKRLSLAIELTQFFKPNLLCIDEPTTGLDSTAAEIVMFCLKKLSQSHKIAIIVSIHQPNNDILLMFDQVYMLAMGGICVFAGPPNQLKAHLTDCINDKNICESNQKPLEVLMKFATNTDNFHTIDIMKDKTLKTMEGLKQKCNIQTKFSPNGIPFHSKIFQFTDLWYLFNRTVLTEYVCQWKSLFLTFLIYLSIPLVAISAFSPEINKPTGCINFNETVSCTDYLKEDSLLDGSYKYLFMSSNLLTLFKVVVTTVSFHRQIKLFLTEHRNKLYSTSVFFVTKTIIDLIPTVLQGIIAAFTPIYWIGLFSQTHKSVNFFLIFTCGLIAAQSLAYVITIVFITNELVAMATAILVFIFNTYLSNSTFVLRKLPVLIQKFSFTSFMKYTFNSFIILVYGMNRCSTLEVSKPLIKFDINDNTFYEYRKSLIIYIIILRVCFLFGLLWRAKTLKTFKLNLNMDKFAQLFKQAVKFRDRIELNEIQNIFDKIDEKSVKEKQISVAWIDLTLKVKSVFGTEKFILNNLTGYFEFGTINALMGPSGAGKTTLLNCFNGKNKCKLSSDTKIYLNRFKTIRTSFISQEISDHIIRGLTAKESLVFASKLKNNLNSKYDHQLMANKIMDELIISDIKDLRTEHCSGGQQKRIALAMELMSEIMPNIICIDEPTSGLDSNSAEAVIKCLKYVSKRNNITIITSIHQPNSLVLSMFDRLYVLTKRGSYLYSGQPDQLENHMTSLGIAVNENQYPIEILMRFASNGFEDISKKLSERVCCEKSDLLLRCNTETNLAHNGIQNQIKSFSCRDSWNILNRFIITTVRYKWKLFLFELTIYCLFGFMLKAFFKPKMIEPNGCMDFHNIYLKCLKSMDSLEEENDLSMNIWIQFFLFSGISITETLLTTCKFNYEVRTVLLEQRNGWYSIGSFYLSKTVIDIVFTLFNYFPYTLIVNFYGRIDTFLITYLLLILSSFTVKGFSHIIAVIFRKSVKNGILVVLYCYALQYIFSNWVVFTKELHLFVQMLTLLSHYKLSLESMLVYIYGFNRCEDTYFSVVLHFLDIEDNTFLSNIYVLIIQLITLRILALITLSLKANGFSRNTTISEGPEQLITRL